ncbi:hypothetical protein HS088_TW21G01108 [Tripterygium wilfordii]|uniref:Uncharacterized protein n=1 Tax=Tripterygium wilfordii TaxID=458696 RepID=A0A7J7C4A7_TRIWF|nr:hypothetical protein HS088_TW21G01108 [Tripterygium wilfordii]
MALEKNVKSIHKKHYPPAILGDEVWRLEKIGKGGSFHKRLNKAGIYTVEDFLRFVVRESQKLRSILGSGMSNKMWDVLVEHTKTCVLSGKLYLHYSDETRNIAVVFNNIYELSGLIANGHYYSTDSLSDDQKVYVDSLVKTAYDDWMHAVEYDGQTLLSFKQNQITGASQIEAPIDPLDFTNSFEHQVALPTLSVPVPPEYPCLDSGPAIPGYDESIGSKFPIQMQNDNLNTAFQLDTTSFRLQNPLTASHQTQLTRSENVIAVGLPESSASGELTPYFNKRRSE